MGALDQMLELLSQQVIPAINPVRSSGIPDPTIDLASPPPTNTPKEKQKNHKKKRLAVDVEDNVDGKRSKGNNYQESELMELCTAWVALSEYSRVGTNQEGTTFWTPIHKRYNAAIPALPQTLKILKSRWGNLQRDTINFKGVSFRWRN
ncbi:hypothetical protein Pst134EB_025351 [Puccinia striiformis f. sp. tritici]|nr:hypothetical protein Pst134EB_025351 [Puccinia striiformis f. sp. tritici]